MSAAVDIANEDEEEVEQVVLRKQGGSYSESLPCNIEWSPREGLMVIIPVPRVESVSLGDVILGLYCLFIYFILCALF